MACLSSWKLRKRKRERERERGERGREGGRERVVGGYMVLLDQKWNGGLLWAIECAGCGKKEMTRKRCVTTGM